MGVLRSHPSVPFRLARLGDVHEAGCAAGVAIADTKPLPAIAVQSDIVTMVEQSQTLTAAAAREAGWLALELIESV